MSAMAMLRTLAEATWNSGIELFAESGWIEQRRAVEDGAIQDYRVNLACVGDV